MRERWLHLSFQIILHGRKRRSMRTSWSKHMQTLKTGNKNKIWIRNIVRQKTNRSSPGWPDCVSEKSRIRVYRTKNIDVTLISIEIFGELTVHYMGRCHAKSCTLAYSSQDLPWSSHLFIFEAPVVEITASNLRSHGKSIPKFTMPNFGWS